MFIADVGSYLDIKFIHLLEKALDTIVAFSRVQKHKFYIASGQECGNLLMIHLQ